MSKFFRSKFIDRRLLMFIMLFKSKLILVYTQHASESGACYLPGVARDKRYVYNEILYT